MNIINKTQFKLSAAALALAASFSPITAVAGLGNNAEYVNTKVEQPVNAEAQLPVYFLGVENNFAKAKAAMPNMTRINIADVDKISADKAALFVIDGNGKVANQTITKLLEQGYPVVGLNNGIKIQDSVHQMLAGTVAKKIISGEIAANIEAPKPRSFAITDSDGGVHHNTLYGYYNGSDLSESYSTIESNPTKALQAAQQWAKNAIASNKAKIKMQANTTKQLHPVWELEHQRIYTTADVFEPNGQVNIRTKFYRLTDDGDNAFDWWTVEFNTEAVPGHQIYNGWNHKGKTREIHVSVDADAIIDENRLVDYAPNASIPNCNNEVGIGLGSGGTDIGWSFTCAGGESITNLSVSSQELASWEHDLHPVINGATENTIVVAPGAQIRVPQLSLAPYLEFVETNKVQFMTNWIRHTYTVTNDISFWFSSSNVGKNDLQNMGYSCTKVYEDQDPHSWTDNWMCVSKDIGLQYSQNQPIPGLTCTSFNEPADPAHWEDNYMCLPNNADIVIDFVTNESQKVAKLNDGYSCISVIESLDPNSWDDNYLCYRLKSNKT